MSAQRLRDAAKVLRELAEAATPGPWHCHDGHLQVKDNCHMPHPVADTWESEDAPYIATMSPPVALALADWLDKEATLSEGFTPREALAVADLILGAES